MPHPLALAAAVAGSLAALGLVIYRQLQEQQNYEQYERTYRMYQEQQRNVFRHTDDFDFFDDYVQEEKTPRDTRQSNSSSELRSRKPFEHKDSSDNERDMVQSFSSSSSAQNQFELTQLEDSIAERKRRLLAEQAFLDKEEESIKQRRMELIRSEQELYNSAESHTEPDTNDINERMMVFNPFADRFEENDSNSSSDESDSSSHHRNTSSSGENTAILIDDTQQHEEDEKEDKFDDASSSSNHHMSSSNLQFPDASQVLVNTTDSETSSVACPSSPRGISDSEESWDAVSENDWTRQSDSE